MRDVAALAGVSLKTVSRVVNDEAGVRADVRTRVLQAATKLDYRHNLAASNLRRTGSRTGVIGVLVQDLANSFSASLVRALEDTWRERGLMVLAASLDEAAEREQQIVENLITRRVDGLVIVPASARHDYLAPEIRAGLPVIFADRAPRGIDTDSVTTDNRRGALQAINHLVQGGHSRIAVLTDAPTIATAEERIRGVQDAFSAHGIEDSLELLRSGLRSDAAAADAVRELMAGANPPTAIFAARNVAAQGAVLGLAELGLRRTVALIGFDDFPLAQLLDPPLTVVRQDVARLGAIVGTRLIDRLDGDTSPPTHEVINPTLVCRGSGEIPPARP